MWGIGVTGWSAILFSIAWLVLLEGLLSADNALVLAVMVRHLPDRRQQKKALRYGIWGAFLFRAIAVVFAAYLLRFWWLKVLGGGYLLSLAGRHFFVPEPDVATKRDRIGTGFWMTVLNVEIADVAFSVDSILAAVAMADRLPASVQHRRLIVIYIGGVLGIIAMRMVAGVFLILLEKFKGLAEGAYLLVAWIGVALVESGLISALRPKKPLEPASWVLGLPDWLRNIPAIPEWLFWAVMVTIFFGSMLYKPKRLLPEPDDNGNGTHPGATDPDPHSVS